MKRGDIVQLSSGGPHMTVVEVEMHKIAANVAWFSKDDQIQHSWFPVDCLSVIYDRP